MTHHNGGVSGQTEHAEGPGTRSGLVWSLGIVGLVCFGVYVWGGYAEHWTWTGLSSQVKLWDWLEALALPVTVGLVPVFLVHRERLHRRHQGIAAAALAGFAVLVLAGYLVPWGWTGFTGNTLWDWLSLALLPLVIATSTLWRSPARWSRRHRSVVAIGAALAVLVVLAGYLVPWGWTGFVGNTGWDWIQLLLLPVLVPTLVLPLVVEGTEAWMKRQRVDVESRS
jgi:MFS family permease